MFSSSQSSSLSMDTPAVSLRRPETPSAASSKPKKNLNFCGVPSFVTFIVGKEAQKFIVHKNLAEHYSPFFTKAFNSGFIEGQTQEMVLEDVEPVTFGLVVNWLYTQKIIHPEDKKVQLVEIANLWVLAGRFLIPQLQNEAIRRTQDTPGYSREEFEPYVKFALKRELEGTQLYQAVLDDVLRLCGVIAEPPMEAEFLEDFVEIVTGEGGNTAAIVIKALVIHCAGFLSNMAPSKFIEDYFVEEGDAASGN